MKSKKKFLLLGVGAMGALALGVGATSTFAWYQVTDAANGIRGDVGSVANVTVAGPAVASTTFKYKITTSFVEQSASIDKSLLLSTWDASLNDGAGGYKTQYLDTAGDPVPHGVTSSETLYKIYAITLSAVWRNNADTADAAGLSDNEKTALLAAATEKYSVSFGESTIGNTSPDNVAKTDGTYGTSIWVQSNTTVGQKGENGATISNLTMTQVASAIASDSGIIGYLVVRMEGSGHTHVGNYTISVTPTVTVA